MTVESEDKKESASEVLNALYRRCEEMHLDYDDIFDIFEITYKRGDDNFKANILWNIDINRLPLFIIKSLRRMIQYERGIIGATDLMDRIDEMK